MPGEVIAPGTPLGFMAVDAVPADFIDFLETVDLPKIRSREHLIKIARAFMVFSFSRWWLLGCSPL